MRKDRFQENSRKQFQIYYYRVIENIGKNSLITKLLLEPNDFQCIYSLAEICCSAMLIIGTLFYKIEKYT